MRNKRIDYQVRPIQNKADITLLISVKRFLIESKPKIINKNKEWYYIMIKVISRPQYTATINYMNQTT